jgi:hypothetical protein
MGDVKKLRLGALGGLLAAGLLLAACGGGTSHAAGASTNVTTTTTGNGPGGNGGGRGAALTAFRDCMSSHGITLTFPARPRNGTGTPPSTTPGETRPQGGFPGFGGGNFADRFKTPPAGVDATKYKAALDACMSKLPARGANGPDSSAFQAYRSCLKDHGVTFPAAGGSGGAGINRNDPKVKAALATCQPLLPTGGFGRSTTTTTIKPA